HATPGRSSRTWLRSLGIFAVGVDLLQNCDDTRAARDRLIERKKQMGRESHDHSTSEHSLKGRAVLFELRHYAFGFFRPKHADKNTRALQIGLDVDVIDGDQRAFKTAFARKDSAQFPFYDSADAQHVMFHVTVSFLSEFLGYSFELIAFDDI